MIQYSFSRWSSTMATTISRWSMATPKSKAQAQAPFPTNVDDGNVGDGKVRISTNIGFEIPFINSGLYSHPLD